MTPTAIPVFSPLASFSPETDSHTFCACDCVVTLLWLYSPKPVNTFFAANGAEHEATLHVFDNHIQEHWVRRQMGRGMRRVPQWRFWKVNDEITSSKKMCRYTARIADDIGLWAGIEANDEVVSVGQEDEDRVERFGAIIGRELLIT
ncbi:hypothetical protein QBC36DRAFT_292391 [Triangularia setosa]|uniref:Uncharacterized protein n=1 Tax=Triangularia setosa TaxID=2587417 RepID=A0AAN6W3S7_9PEZI|nr:hypothetical protein QBC36DRAFT_292391 [Podospora setosa]